MLQTLNEEIRLRHSMAEDCAGQPRAAPTATLRADYLRLSQTGHNPKAFQKTLIAIVDDDQHAREGLQTLVESLDHDVVTFASAEEYLAWPMRNSTACLILDVHLPGMSGPDLQDRLVAAAHCPAIVFATGRFEEHVRKHVIDAGALGYLIKPCNAKALFDCIGKVLAKAA